MVTRTYSSSRITASDLIPVTHINSSACSNDFIGRETSKERASAWRMPAESSIVTADGPGANGAPDNDRSSVSTFHHDRRRTEQPHDARAASLYFLSKAMFREP